MSQLRSERIPVMRSSRSHLPELTLETVRIPEPGICRGLRKHSQKSIARTDEPAQIGTHSGNAIFQESSSGTHSRDSPHPGTGHLPRPPQTFPEKHCENG